LQTFCAAFQLDDCGVRQVARPRQIDLQNMGNVLEAVTGNGRDLWHGASGLREHGDGCASQVVKMQVDDACGNRRLVPVLVKVALGPRRGRWAL
jgi:hypothetical protein